MKDIKVGILINGLEVGGAETLILNMLKVFKEKFKNYQFFICYLSGKGTLAQDIKLLGYKVFDLGAKTRLNLSVIARLSKIFREVRVDILHLHLPRSGFIGRLAARLANIQAVVYTEHSLWSMYPALSRYLNRLTINMNSVIISVSEGVKKSILASRRVSQEKVRTVYNGVDLDALNAVDVDKTKKRLELGIPLLVPVVGNVANLSPPKGHEYLLRAAPQVLRLRPDVRFVIVGRDDGEARDLNKLVVQLGIEDRVIFTGFRKDVAEVISIFDLFVLSSLFEGMSVALLEAMALGKPTVVTTVGGNTEVVVDGVTGLHVPPCNSDAMATAILNLLDNSPLMASMGEAAVLRVKENFTIESMAMQYERIYRELFSVRLG